MCGIAGYIGKNINFPTDLQIEKCINLMKEEAQIFNHIKNLMIN